jgi:RNAse (barnase) inhibitor barstar
MDFKIFDLPIDVINHIIPYTYSVQPKELLEDIRSYYDTKKIIEKIYFNSFYDDFFIDDKVNKCWLINDLFAFENNHNFYNIFSRNIMLKKDYEKNKFFIGNLENKKIEIQINIFWGLFTPEERNEFIDIVNMDIANMKI